MLPEDLPPNGINPEPQAPDTYTMIIGLCSFQSHCPRIIFPHRCYQQPSFDAKAVQRIYSKTNKVCWKTLALLPIVRMPNR